MIAPATFTNTADPVQNLLEHLQGVKSASQDKWTAKCPAHDDQHASLGTYSLIRKVEAAESRALFINPENMLDRIAVIHLLNAGLVNVTPIPEQHAFELTLTQQNQQRSSK